MCISNIIISFSEWLLIEENGSFFSGLEEKQGRELLADPAMEASMYLAYRAAYNEVAKKDYEEDLANAKAQGRSTDGIKFQPPWSMDEWKYPSSGGVRAPEWIFLGIFPSATDLQKVQEGLQQYENAQALADADIIQMPNVGGVSYRNNGDSIKMTGSWGWNAKAKMFAMAQVAHQATQNNQELFTGADHNLMDMIQRSKGLLSKLHQKGKIPYGDFGLEGAPKDMSPFIYNSIQDNPKFSGGGRWTGFNDDGSFNFELSGVGERKKHLLGNKTFWGNQIKSLLTRMGVDNKQMVALKAALSGPSFMANMAANQVNKQLAKARPGTSPLSADALRWALSHAES